MTMNNHSNNGAVYKLQLDQGINLIFMTLRLSRLFLYNLFFSVNLRVMNFLTVLIQNQPYPFEVCSSIVCLLFLLPAGSNGNSGVILSAIVVFIFIWRLRLGSLSTLFSMD